MLQEASSACQQPGAGVQAPGGRPLIIIPSAAPRPCPQVCSRLQADGVCDYSQEGSPNYQCLASFPGDDSKMISCSSAGEGALA